LLAGAEMARLAAVAPALIADEAVVEGDVIGPFQLQATDAAAIALTAGNVVLDAAGVAVTGPLQPKANFYIRRNPGSTGTTVRVEVPGHPDGFGGRVITGVAHDEVADRFTPLALAVPAKLVVEFDIAWG
jgi:hypothetical protein